MMKIRRIVRSRRAIVGLSVVVILLSVNTTPMAATQEGAADPQTSEGLPGLETRVREVEQDVGELNTTAIEQATDLTDLTARVLALETSVSELQDQVNSLEGDMADVKGQVAQLAVDVSELKTQVASLEGAVTTLQETVAVLQERVAAFEAIASELQGQLDQLNALNSLSSLSDGIKGLLAWIRLPNTTVTSPLPVFEVLTCPVGVPLQVMLFAGQPVIVEGMAPNPAPRTPSGPGPVDIAAPGGIVVRYRVDYFPYPSDSRFEVTRHILCLNVDGLTAMAPDLNAPIVP